jgi:hypothetical protein
MPTLLAPSTVRGLGGAVVINRCVRCDDPMRSQRSPSQTGIRIHRGCGLCSRCYDHIAPTQRVDFPTVTRRRDDLLEDYVILRAEGMTWRQCAQRLDVNYTAFERAMNRARAAGDPRAARPGERWPVAA